MVSLIVGLALTPAIVVAGVVGLTLLGSFLLAEVYGGRYGASHAGFLTPFCFGCRGRALRMLRGANHPWPESAERRWGLCSVWSELRRPVRGSGYSMPRLGWWALW